MQVQEKHHSIIDASVPDIQKQFTFDTSGRTFSLLLDRIYSDKPYAVVRELVQNAYDAHVETDQDAPFEIKIPTALNPRFSVRDYGAGMSDEFMLDGYCVVTHSTKSQSNTSVGGLGIGRMSALALADSYHVTSWRDGWARVYTVYLNDRRIPTITKVSETPCDPSETGVLVSVVVPKDLHQRMDTIFKQALRYYPPELYSIDQTISQPNYVFRNEYFGITNRIIDQRRGVKVIMGPIAYALPDNYSPGINAPWANINIDLFVPIGAVDVLPSREGLELTARTKAILDQRFAMYAAHIDGYITAKLDNAENEFQKGCFANELDKTGFCYAHNQRLYGLTYINRICSEDSKALAFSNICYVKEFELAKLEWVTELAPKELYLNDTFAFIILDTEQVKKYGFKWTAQQLRFKLDDTIIKVRIVKAFDADSRDIINKQLRPFITCRASDHLYFLKTQADKKRAVRKNPTSKVRMSALRIFYEGKTQTLVDPDLDVLLTEEQVCYANTETKRIVRSAEPDYIREINFPRLYEFGLRDYKIVLAPISNTNLRKKLIQYSTPSYTDVLEAVFARKRENIELQRKARIIKHYYTLKPEQQKMLNGLASVFYVNCDALVDDWVPSLVKDARVNLKALRVALNGLHRHDLHYTWLFGPNCRNAGPLYALDEDVFAPQSELLNRYPIFTDLVQHAIDGKYYQTSILNFVWKRYFELEDKAHEPTVLHPDTE